MNPWEVHGAYGVSISMPLGLMCDNEQNTRFVGRIMPMVLHHHTHEVTSEKIMTNAPNVEPKNPASDTESGTNKASALYDRFTEKSREIFDQGQEKGREAWEKAMELSRQQLGAAGEFSAEQGELFKQYLRRDLDQTAADMRQMGEQAKEHLDPSRLGAGALSTLSKLLHAAGGAVSALSAKADEALEYRTGEITMAGTLTCTGCGAKVQLKATGVVPTCSACQGTHFRKGY